MTEASQIQVRVDRWDEPEPPSLDEMRETLREEGFNGIHTFRDAPGTRYAEHEHDFIEVRWIYKGEITFGIGEENYTLTPGDRLDVPADTTHDAQMHPKKGAAYVCASKDPD